MKQYRKTTSMYAWSLVALGVLCANLWAAQGNAAKSEKSQVKWLNSVEANKLSKKDSALVFMEIYADWCGPCHVMEATTFQDKTVAKLLNTRFHAIRVNAESQEPIMCVGQMLPATTCVTEVLGIEGVPTLIFLSPTGRPVVSLTTALDPQQMVELLTEVLDSKKKILQEEAKQAANESAGGGIYK